MSKLARRWPDFQGRYAALLGGLLWSMGCGHSTSTPGSDGPQNMGGSMVSAAGSAGEGGAAEVPAAGRASGGAASAGGTSGGASSAGVGGSTAAGATGGDPALANLPLPAGCQALRGATTDLLCSVDVTCDGVLQTTHCYRTTDAWQCTCDPPNADRTYLIEGAEELDACAVGAGLCSESPSSLAPDLASCVVSRDEQGSQAGSPSCTVELQCENPVPVDFAPGVEVTMPGSGLVKCVAASDADPNTQPQRVDCVTSGTLGAQTYAVVAQSVASACRPVLEHYLSEKEAKFDGSKSCVVKDEDVGSPGSCLLTETCFDGAPLSGSVSLVRAPSERRASCGFDDLNNLSCGCSFTSASGEMAHLSYDLGPAQRPARCDLSQCTLDMKVEPTGSGVCQAQMYVGQYEDDGCVDYFGCTQPGTLAGRAVQVYSQLNARCARGADRVFYCGCGAGDQTAKFRAGSLATSQDACGLALTACLEHVSLPLGPAPTPANLADPLLDL